MSLCTRSQVKLRLDIADGETAYDAVIDAIRDGVSALIAGAEGAARDLEQADLIEVRNVPDPVSRALWLHCWPVVAIAEVLERSGASELWADLTALTADTDYQVNAASGLLLRASSWWPQGLQVVRISYEAGYVTPDTQAGVGWTIAAGEVVMPADLVEAAVQQAVHVFQRRRDPAQLGGGTAGGNIYTAASLGAAELLPGVAAVARRYRRVMG